MINEYLFRLALVVNTSHSKFYDNLTNIIIYILYVEQSADLSVNEIVLFAQEKLGLEFASKEVLAATRQNQQLFVMQRNGRIALSDIGVQKIHEENTHDMQRVIDYFVETFDLDVNVIDISETIYKFLYGCLNQNIEVLLNVIQGHKDKFPTMDYLTNDQRKIVNDFIDWDYEPKNRLLVQLISFSVDYCRLTVKKDSNNFKNLLNGKKFYLDANIFFRMMGVNNSERQESIMRFIEKCKKANVKLCYTTITRQEMMESIHFHVNDVKKILQGYHGQGQALENLYKRSAYQDGFVSIYLKWCKEGNIHGEYPEYEQFLKRKFFECAKDIKLEEAKGISVSDEVVEDYIQYKDNRIRRDNAIYDIQNVQYVDKKRKGMSTIGWNVNEYLISADHKLIDWSMKNISSTNPIVVLPSVWYSIILKISGRAQDEEKSFVEFIKMRYIQDCPETNIRYLINTVCQKTSSGELQDMLFEEISSNNNELNQIYFSINEDEIGSVVEQTYENILGRVQMTGYENGKKEGAEEGFCVGKSEGFENGKKRGERIGVLKTKIEHLKDETNVKAVKIQRRHIAYSICICIGSIIIIYLVSRNLKNEQLIELYNRFKILVYFFPMIVSSGLASYIFTFDLEKIKKEEEIKIEPKIRELQYEIESLESLE